MSALIAFATNVVTNALHPITSYLSQGGSTHSVDANIRARPDEAEPFVRHLTLHRSNIRGRNLLIVGDVHGCYDEMRKLIATAEHRSDRPLLVLFVGDIVRKGPHSLDVLRYVRAEKNCYTVRGNHEEKVVRSILASKRNDDQVLSQKLSERDLSWVHQLSGEDFDYLRNLPYTINIPDLNITLLHGGVVPHSDITATPPETIMTLREVVMDSHWFHGTAWRACMGEEAGRAWSTAWGGPQHIYFGHDAVRKLQLNEHATGLDSGCVYGGKLTGVLLQLADTGGHVRPTIVSRDFIEVEAAEIYRPVKNK